MIVTKIIENGYLKCWITFKKTNFFVVIIKGMGSMSAKYGIFFCL